MSTASALAQRAYEASIDGDPAAAQIASDAADAYEEEAEYTAELYAESAAAYARGE